MLLYHVISCYQIWVKPLAPQNRWDVELPRSVVSPSFSTSTTWECRGVMQRHNDRRADGHLRHDHGAEDGKASQTFLRPMAFGWDRLG